ncbi:MAG: hypothetical protein QXF45_07390 [Candidatus Caldarchaeum sp.]
MKLFPVLTALLLLCMVYPLTFALSPPVEATVPLTGNPIQIDSDGKNLLAVAFSDKNVLGIYFVDHRAYVEIDLPSPVVKTVFHRNMAVALLRGGTAVAIVDLTSRRLVDVVNLDFAASSISSDERWVYLGFSRTGRIDRFDVESRQTVESINIRFSDGVKHLASGGGILYAVSANLDSIIIIGDKTSSVKVDGIVSMLAAGRDGVWVVLTDDTVLKMSGSSIVFKTTLPRATFVNTISTLDGKLVYGSISRRVVGIVDETGTRETRVADLSPVSVAVTSSKMIWLLDGSSMKLWYLFDSVPPRIFDWNLENRPDGSTLVRVKVSDVDNDINFVDLVVYEQQGVLPLGPSSIRMELVKDFYEATYRPGPSVTRAELFVNATDSAGNSVVQKVGELDYSRSTTSPAVTTVTTVLGNPIATPLLLSDLLLLVPLILVVTLLLFARRPRRKTSKKR